MTTVSLRLDDDMKRQLEEMCDGMSLSLNSFFTMCAETVLNQYKIISEDDRALAEFQKESYLRHLQKSIQQVKNGQVVVKTMEELEAMALD